MLPAELPLHCDKPLQCPAVFSGHWCRSFLFASFLFPYRAHSSGCQIIQQSQPLDPPPGPLTLVSGAPSDGFAVRAVLQQMIDDKWYPLAYFSRKQLHTADVQAFHYFVKGPNFFIVTNHKPLTYALTARSTTAVKGTSLVLQPIAIPTTDVTLLCDVATGTPRPYVPKKLCQLFTQLHGLSYPGIYATKLLTSKHVYPSMNGDICQWTCVCLACQ